jgi:exonuclease SbcD
MIKLLHLADLHIGVENYGRIDAATGLHSRLLDYLARLDEAFDLALAEGVDLVLIAGDIYKNRTPNPTHQREFARRLRRVTGNGIPVFILTGNHDVSPAAGRAHAVEIFNTLAVDGVTIADRPALHLLETPGGPIQIVALPWVSRHALLTREELKMASLQEVELELRRRVDYFIEETAAGLDRAIPAVLAFHGSVEGASPGAERTISLGSDMVLTRSVVAQPQFDYVALGHIHKHQALGQHPPLVYPGSIERIDFGEEAEDKGCVLVELAQGEARWRFHKLAARPFVTIAADLRTSSDPEGRVAALIERQDLREAVVRVQLQASREQAAALREERVRELLEEANAFYVAAVSVEVPRSERGRFAAVEQELASGLTPRRALELYLLSKNTAPERIAQLLAAHDTLAAEP